MTERPDCGDCRCIEDCGDDPYFQQTSQSDVTSTTPTDA